MKEPSVLDYVKALLTPWKGKPPAFPAEEEESQQEISPESPAKDELPVDYGPSLESMPELPQGEPLALSEDVEPTRQAKFPWLGLAALILALIAQIGMEPPDQRILPAVILYGLAGVLLVLALWRNELVLPVYSEAGGKPFSMLVYRNPLVISVPLLLFAGFLFLNNRFTLINVLLWLAGVTALVIGLRIKPAPRASIFQRLKTFLRQPAWTFKISGWTMLVLAVSLVIIFFRFYRLDQVPGEMFSDHAEKLMDVANVYNGEFSIFFPRNTGREAFQMYLTALVGLVFGTKLSFMSLKIGTALAGLFTLPYIYLLGKEIGGRRVALFALILAGVAYWPNVISRIGLRFPLYPLFAAPTLYYLIRGLRRRQRNDFIWAGIALGLGLHGYSPARLLPLAVLVGFGLYWLHKQSIGNRKESVIGLSITALVSLAVFLPLMVYALDNPQMFGYRALSRLAETETTFSAPVMTIFFDNLWKSLTMFFYNNGNIWVHSVTGRPALDVVSAVLFFFGVVLVIVRYFRQRAWLDLFLLLAIPILMLPSILSLAFPEENPSLNRSGAAIVPVFILAGIGLDSLVQSLRRRFPSSAGKVSVSALVAILLWLSASANFDLVFRQFDQQFIRGAWNTSQIGHVIRAFAESQGNRDTAYVIPYPHWVDTRLVGINAGDPLKDYALWLDDVETTLADPRAKLFVIKPEHTEAVDKISGLYPQGSLYLYDAPLEGKDFLLYFVPPQRQ